MKSEIQEIEKRGREAVGGVKRQPVRVGLVGATGYAGRELMVLLSRHPGARLVHLMSSGRHRRESFPIERVHPSLRKKESLICVPLRESELRREDLDLVFLSTPYDASVELIPPLLKRGLRVIDLSGGFRLRNPELYPKWYGFEHHAPEALEEAVYGVTELAGEAVQRARLVANPGCYATAAILALVPLLEAGWLVKESEIICDAKSGVSGAGRAPNETTHFVEVNESCRAYGLFSHRHVPEILQALHLDEEQFRFTPHLIPITRGILASLYLRLEKKRSREEVAGLFEKFYGRAPLVRVYADPTLPEIKAVQGTQFCDLGFSLDETGRRLTVVSCLDNLGKGAAGQAVQNMNLMFGWDEETGLL